MITVKESPYNTIDVSFGTQHLVIRDCLLLEKLPDLPALESLELYNCPSLEKVPNYPKLRSLLLDTCAILKSIKSSSINKLDITACPSILEISGNLLEHLDINFLNIKSINSLKNLKTLNIINCSKLKTIYNVPQLITLKIIKCKRIKSISGANIINLYIDQCKIEQINCPNLSKLICKDSECSSINNKSTLIDDKTSINFLTF